MEQDINENIKILEEHLSFIKNFDNGSKYIPALENLIKAYKELEEKNKKKSIEIICYQEELENSIPVSLVEEKLKKEKLPNIIVGGRRNAKTLEYGKKLGRIEMCEELLEKRK